MLANWRFSYPQNPANISDIAAADEAVCEFAPRGNIESPEDRIPLFGVTHIDKLELLPDGNTTWIGTIHLIRALAKITVTDADLTNGVNDGLQITDVRLVNFNDKVAMAPRGVTHQDHYVKGSYVKDYLDQITLPNNPLAEKKDTPFTKISGVFQLFVPEFDNLDSPEKSRILVTYSDGMSFYVDFKYYSGQSKNQPFNIKRNIWYQFDVKRSTANIDCEVDVIPYASIVLDPEFGIKPPDSPRPVNKL